MIRRYSSAVVLGGVVTFALFFLMQSLIAYGTARGQDEVLGSVIDFVMVTNESETQTKRRRPPRKLKDERPPEPPDIELDRARKPQTQNASHSFGAFDFGDLQGGPHLGGAPTDGDILPLVRIEPRYPSRALHREIEGWVLLEFSISPAGTVVNPFVVDSEPRRIFDRSALRAVSRWKYKPKVEDGAAVIRHGVQVVLTFELED